MPDDGRMAYETRVRMSDPAAELIGLLEDPVPTPERIARRQALVARLDLEALRGGDEQSRWIAYLASLDVRVVRGELTDVQRCKLLWIWRRAQQACQTVRRPCIGHNEDGQVHLSWGFTDRPGITFTIDIEPDGRVDWFYRNVADARIEGTKEEPEDDLPDEALMLLAPFAA